ncbi:MAG: TonB-dependent receptor [Cyclobacteriaceae bacterium]
MKILFTLVAWLTMNMAMGQNEEINIQGKVSDSGSEAPLIGVSIFVPELRRGTVTDDQGIFSLTSLPPGRITLQVSYMGYATIITKTNPSQQNSFNFQLEETTTSVEEVVVSAAYVMSRESSPISIEKMNKNDILKSPAPSLMSALAKIPGISEVSLGPGISKPVIRGLSFSRVLSVYQGARFENQQWGADHGLGLTETGLSGVEIIKGPASIIYGSGAMAGVVNLLEDADASPGTTQGDVNLRFYSNTLGARAEAGMKGTTETGITWSLRGASESHADYLDGDRNPVGNTRFATQNIKAGMGLQKKWGDTRIRYTYLKQNLGILDENNRDRLVTSRNDRSIQLPFQIVSDHFLNSETNVFLGEDKIKTTFGYHWNFREETEVDFNQVDLGLEQSNFMYDLKYYHALSQNLEAIFGIQGFYLQTINYPDAAEILIPDASKDDRSAYGLLNYSHSNWVLQGGVRYDYRMVKADGRAQNFLDYGFELPGSPESRMISRTFDGITASGGATFRPNESWRFRLNVASGFRAPDLAELYSNGPHPGTSRFEQGNANFIREQNIQSDLGIRYKSSDFTLALEGFYNRVNNYIFFAPTDEKEGDLTIWRFEQDNARLVGGEGLLEIHPSSLSWWRGSTSYSMVIGQRISDLSYLPYIPAFRWNQDLAFTFKDIGRWGKPYFNLTGSLILDQNRSAELEEATPGYYLMGLDFGGSFEVGEQVVEVFVSGTNILNVSYLDHMSLYRPFGIRQTGRNVALSFRFSF